MSRKDYLRELKKPFEANEIEWRINRHGFSGAKPWATAIPYITSRAVQDRLDEVFGLDGWSNEIKMVNNKGFLACIKIKIDDEWIAKWDGAEGSESNSMDLIKSGSSNALKRAAVLLGIGRYLYDLDESFVECEVTQSYRHPYGNVYKDKKNANQLIAWKEPILPPMALPGFNIKQYIDDIKKAASNTELNDAFILARKAANLHDSKEMLDAAKAAGSAKRVELKEMAALTVVDDTKKIESWLDTQIRSFAMLPNSASVETVFTALTKELGAMMKGTLVDKLRLKQKLDDSYQLRLNELNVTGE